MRVPGKGRGRRCGSAGGEPVRAGAVAAHGGQAEGPGGFATRCGNASGGSILHRLGGGGRLDGSLAARPLPGGRWIGLGLPTLATAGGALIAIAEAGAAPAVGGGQLGIGGWFHAVGFGPGEFFFRGEAAAVPPAFFGVPAAAGMALAGEGLAQVLVSGSRQRTADGNDQVSDRGEPGNEPAP